MSFSPKPFKASINQLKLPTVLEKLVDTDDLQGGDTEAWLAQTGTLWAAEQQKVASFRTEGGEMLVEVKHHILMRWFPTLAVLGSDRWRFNGPFGIWYIESVNDPSNDQKWAICICSEVPS